MSVDPDQPEPQHEHFEEGAETAPPGARVMAIVRWLLVLAMAAAAVASILYVYGNTGHAEGHPSTQYYCPMHPSVVQDHPGDCPICSMTLVPREHAEVPTQKPATASRAEHRHEANVAADAATPAPQVAGLTPVEIPAQRVQLIGMRTAPVTRTTLPAELKAVGYVAATESGLAVVQTRFAGWIEELLVAETGQQVQKGQLLARVYSPELFAAQQELLNARRWSAGKEGEVGDLATSARTRLELLGMLHSEIDEVERTGVPHRLVEIRSPARGYIAQKSAVQGLTVQPGTRLFDIADLSKVWVFIELFERDAGRIKQGQRASLRLNAYPGETFSGKVQFVYPTLSTETRTLRARVEFANRELRLRPGMFGDVSIQQAQAQGLMIPSEAVVDTGEQQYVFVAEGHGRFAPRVVRLGPHTEDQVQVLTGLEEGETVVTTGNFLIDSESRLRFAIEGGESPEHKH